MINHTQAYIQWWSCKTPQTNVTAYTVVGTSDLKYVGRKIFTSGALPTSGNNDALKRRICRKCNDVFPKTK